MSITVFCYLLSCLFIDILSIGRSRNLKGTVKSRYAIENLSSEEVEGVRQLNLTEYIQGSSNHTQYAKKRKK